MGYNLSDSLIDAMHYKDAFNVCEKSIAFCKLTGNLNLLPELLYNRAKALYYMDCKNEAEKGFKHSRATYLAHGNTELAEFVKNTVSEKYQIYLQ